MSVSFTLHQVSTIEDGPLYKVKNEVTAATDASPAVFVYKTATQAYIHVAMVADMEQWSDSYDQALIDGTAFYRQTSVTREWDTTLLASADIDVTKSRLQLLANDMNRLQGSFIADDTTVITGE
jgi:hypothetical protein